MVGGFNHNFSYKGHTYHVQTEDSGLPRARITTLLYRAGSILARETTDYTNISTATDLPSKVEHMMREQHRSMLKNLKDGAFDGKIAQLSSPANVGAELGSPRGVEAHKTATSETLSAGPTPSEAVSVSEWRAGPLEDKVKKYLDAGR